MKNGCMENETYRLNWVLVDKINESLFEAVANDMEKFPEKYKNVKVVERDKIIEALKNVDNYLQKIAELEQELAELKQKAIVPKFKIGHYEKSNQDKISFAVEQLEKLKVKLHIIHTNGYLKAIDEEIDDQIKSLKGEE